MIRIILILLTLLNSNISHAFEEGKCISQAAKVCIEDSEKEIEGFITKQCWKYKEVFRCTSKEENNCTAFESNRGCNEIKGECVEQSPTGLCNHYEKIYACGRKGVLEDKEIKIINAEFKVLKDEKDLAGCSQEMKDKYCDVIEEKCLEGPETRNINGKDVHKECWKWDRRYRCRTDTHVDECKPFREKGCIEKTRECLHQAEGRCDHYVVQYECDNKTTEKVDCLASKFCIGDVCEEQKRKTNNNFGLAASYLGVLSQVQKDGEGCGCNQEKDPDCSVHSLNGDQCKLFKGESFQCSIITGEYNCCSNKGFIKPLFGCNEQEKELGDRQRAKACHYVGSWEEWIIDLKHNKSHCCFNSPLARIIQEQGRKQLGIGWGDKKNPNCRALTLDEIQRIDFTKINFDELYTDLKEKAKKDFAAGNKNIAEKFKSLQGNQPGGQNIIQDKMKRFYGK